MKSPTLLALAVAPLLLAACASTPPPRTVERVDLKRYSGQWHEIARYPNWFQRRCASNVTATYTPNPDGTIAVVNRCRAADGKSIVARATARPVPGTNNSQLKVTFVWPFSGDYWILALDEKSYEWALVGTPSRDFLWILARRPSLNPATYERILAEATLRGFDTTRLQPTPTQ